MDQKSRDARRPDYPAEYCQRERDTEVIVKEESSELDLRLKCL